MSKRVEGVGPINAKIVIVGEAPGREEEESGLPFVGESGQLLNRLLDAVGIKRDTCYITNVVKVRPPANKLERLHELGLRVEDFYPELNSELEKVKPNIVIALGTTAMTALCGLTEITKWRGSILTYNGIKVIPAYHPAACLRQYDWRHILKFDLTRALKESEFSEVRRRERTLTINPSFEACLVELARLEKSEYLSLDIETLKGTRVIRTVGLGDSADRAFCIPFVSGYTPVWTQAEEKELWLRLAKLLTSPIKIICQNAQFEMTLLAPFTGGRMRVWFDTLRSHALLYPEFPHALHFLTSIYTDVPYYKEEGQTEKGRSFDDLQIYNCKDVVVTYEIAFKLLAELEEVGLSNFYSNYDLPLSHTLWRMQTGGVNIDQTALSKGRIEVEGKITNLRTLFTEQYGQWVNTKSHKQMTEFLYNRLKLPKRHKQGKVTANEEALLDLYHKTQRPELMLLLEERRLRTLKETFLNMKLSEDGRIRTSYGVTSTGRLSSSADVFGVGCVPSETEVLTFSGWIQIKDVTPETIVAQYNQTTKEISFTKTTLIHGSYCDKFYHLGTSQIQQYLTPNHRVLYQDTRRENHYTKPADYVASLSNIKIPISGSYVGGFYQPTAPELLVMALADFSYEGKKVRGMFKKQRKIDRCLQLLTKYNVPYTEQKAKEGYRRFSFIKPPDWPDKKEWGIWILSLTNNIREVMLDELKYWDGLQRNKSTWFFTADRHQALWVSTMAHLSNRSTTITGGGNQRPEAYGTYCPWTVNIKPRTYTQVGWMNWEVVNNSRDVYCLSVPDTYFLIRYKDKISITGNSNLQNIPKKKGEWIRRIFIPSKGKVWIKADLSQADARSVAWLAKDETLKRLFREGGDVHTKVAAIITGKPINAITKQERTTAKNCVHGANYGLGAEKFGKLAGITKLEAERSLSDYHRLFPNVRSVFHREIEDKLRRDRTLVNSFGRRRVFFGRYNDDLLRQAYAQIPQSNTGDCLNSMLPEIEEALPEGARLLIQVHDEINLEAFLMDVPAIVQLLKSKIERPILVGDDLMEIPLDVSVGPNWADCIPFEEWKRGINAVNQSAL